MKYKQCVSDDVQSLVDSTPLGAYKATYASCKTAVKVKSQATNPGVKLRKLGIPAVRERILRLHQKPSSKRANGPRAVIRARGTSKNQAEHLLFAFRTGSPIAQLRHQMIYTAAQHKFRPSAASGLIQHTIPVPAQRLTSPANHISPTYSRHTQE